MKALALLRASGKFALFALAAGLPPLLWGVGTLVSRFVQATNPPNLASQATVEATPTFDPSKRIAVVITGNHGAEMTDFLIPYETLATTGAFNMYVVAPQKKPVPLASAASLNGGLDLLPHFSLEEYNQTIQRAPDLIVIPYLPGFEDGKEEALVPWILAHAKEGAKVVSICAGSEVLAATGLIDEQKATTHPNFFARLEKKHPKVQWVRDVRYVETEKTISSGAIASGMDATLAAIRKLLGRAAAEEVAAKLKYPHTRFLDDPSYRTTFDLRAVAKAAFSERQEVGVVLYNGVSELALGSIFDTYPTSTGYGMVSLSDAEGVITTKNGMWLLPRYRLDNAPALSQVFMPGAGYAEALNERVESWASARSLRVAYIHKGASGFAYDAALQEISRQDSQIVALSIATALNYPTEGLSLEGPWMPSELIVWPAVLSALGVGLLLGLRRWRRAAA